MASMHPTMSRLYAAFAEIARAANPKAKIGQSALARKLGTTPQRVKNWESRGISQGGALEAQRKLGVNATWILDNRGPMLITTKAGTASHPLLPDPSILYEALSLIVWDESVAGRYQPRAYADRLAELYARVAASGGVKLSDEENEAYLREVEARKRGSGSGDESKGERAARRE